MGGHRYTRVCSLSLPLSHIRGENLPPLVQVDEVSGAQDYWNSGAVPGPLGGEIKTDDPGKIGLASYSYLRSRPSLTPPPLALTKPSQFLLLHVFPDSCFLSLTPAQHLLIRPATENPNCFSLLLGYGSKLFMGPTKSLPGVTTAGFQPSVLPWATLAPPRHSPWRPLNPGRG